METATLTIYRVRHYPEKNGFFFGDSSMGSVVGQAEFIANDTTIEAEGEWKNNATYGRQFHIRSFRYRSTEDALRVLIGSGFLKGIKGGKVDAVIETLGERTMDVLDAAAFRPLDLIPWRGKQVLPAVALQAVHGVGPVVSMQMVESWKERGTWARAALLCVTAGLSVSQAKKAYRRFGDDLSRVIIETPYRLTVIDGITWKKADAIAKMEWPGKTAIDHDDPQRYCAAIREVLRQQGYRGHMCYPQRDTFQEAIALCQPNLNLEETIEDRLDYEDIYIRDEFFYTWDNLTTEEDSAHMLVGLASSAPLSSIRNAVSHWDDMLAMSMKTSPTDESPYRYKDVILSDDQVRAIDLALHNQVSIITGGPGTGKTTTLRVLLNILENMELTYTLCAPTGKAARRMVDATGRPAATIHKTLGLPMEASDIYTDYLIVDETSMVDAELLCILLDCCLPGHRVVFVGDVDQLPPVGAGEPFYQMIEAGLPTARLTTIHRQEEGSGIVAAAASIRNGQYPEVSSDFRIARVGNNGALKYTLLDYIQRIMEKYGLSIHTLQVMTPVNGNDWGRISLNKALKEMFNPGKEVVPGVPYNVGDKVIHLKNNYQLGVMNGQVGQVVWVGSRDTSQPADLFSVDPTPSFWQLFEEKKNNEESDTKPDTVVKVDYGDEKPVQYNREMLEQLDWAYALTVHKMQGDEAEGCVILMPRIGYEDFMVRQLPYTAITRARRYAIIITAQDALKLYIENAERLRRYTCLGRFISDSLAGGRDDD